MSRTNHSDIEGPSALASPTSSHTLSIPASPQNAISPPNRETEPTTYVSEAIAQWELDMSQATYCDFDLSGEELSGSEYEEHQKKRIARAREYEKHRLANQPKKQDPERMDYGNLPLIDVWVAQSMKWSQEKVRSMEGYCGKEEVEKKEEEEGDGGGDEGKESEARKVPVEALLDGTSAFMCGLEVMGGVAMPFPDDDDPVL